MVHCMLLDFGYSYSLYHAAKGIPERRVERKVQKERDRLRRKAYAEDRDAWVREEQNRARDDWWWDRETRR